jgi:hypothetical protein
MIRLLLLSILAGCLIVVGGCDRPAGRVQARIAERYVSDPGSVGFDIELLQSGNGSSQWMATYTAQGKVAKFEIELGPTKALDDDVAKDSDLKAGEGRFVSEAGSDASVLLVDLQKALEAKTVPKKARRVSALPFTFVNLGEHLSQASDGGLGASPPGNWTAIKLFIGEGEQEGDVFLNLNPVIKKGQFSIKDEDYGDQVLAQLAKVL